MDGTLSRPRIMGLTRDEVAGRIARGQVNRAEQFTTRTVSGILRHNGLTVFNGILAASVTALIVISAYSDAIFLSAVTCANTLVGIFAEFRAKWALDRLVLLRWRTVTVVREGGTQAIALDAVVQDDVVAFGPGDPIVVDGVLLSASPVSIDESLLTGEADPRTKQAGDPVFSGSFCVSGSGQYQATHVGKACTVNRLTAQAKAYKLTRTPLQKSINTLIQMLTGLMTLFVVLLLMANYIKDVSTSMSILSMVTVIKALVPEELVLILQL